MDYTGIAFVSSAETAAGGNSSADANIYSASQWSQMEAAGAVFLPAAGARSGTYVGNVGTTGFYWSGGRQTEVTARSM